MTTVLGLLYSPTENGIMSSAVKYPKNKIKKYMSLLSRAQDDAILHNVKRVIMYLRPIYGATWADAGIFLRALLSPLNVETGFG
jgi:hypothetical protein